MIRFLPALNSYATERGCRRQSLKRETRWTLRGHLLPDERLNRGLEGRVVEIRHAQRIASTPRAVNPRGEQLRVRGRPPPHTFCAWCGITKRPRRARSARRPRITQRPSAGSIQAWSSSA